MKIELDYKIYYMVDSHGCIRKIKATDGSHAWQVAKQLDPDFKDVGLLRKEDSTKIKHHVSVDASMGILMSYMRDRNKK